MLQKSELRQLLRRLPAKTGDCFLRKRRVIIPQPVENTGLHRSWEAIEPEGSFQLERVFVAEETVDLSGLFNLQPHVRNLCITVQGRRNEQDGPWRDRSQNLIMVER